MDIRITPTRQGAKNREPALKALEQAWTQCRDAQDLMSSVICTQSILATRETPKMDELLTDREIDAPETAVSNLRTAKHSLAASRRTIKIARQMQNRSNPGPASLNPEAPDRTD